MELEQFREPTEYQLLSYFLNIQFNTEEFFCNPFRRDNSPGCRFFVTEKGTPYFIDFAASKSYDWRKAAIERTGKNLSEIAHYVLSHRTEILEFSDAEYIHKPKKDILALVDSFTESDINFWSQFGITLEILRKFEVAPVKAVYKDGERIYSYKRNDPIYRYKFPSGRFKLYRPLIKDKKKKWGGTSNMEDISGLKQALSHKDLCIITSSLKDVMTLNALGFTAIAFNGEGYGAGNKTVEYLDTLMRVLSRKFRHVCIFYDHDEAGIEASIKLSNKYNIPYFTTGSKCKDISDYYKKYKRHKACKLVKSKLAKIYGNYGMRSAQHTGQKGVFFD